ncbi:hypothetical protein Tco_1045113 [Tanacetum coccineum]|uniref:Uncharacterized protein n=1 Tax=Tanacetum coccineum TaxID=301880 RepID=A0ABQ5GRU3_9ASTR
MFERTQHQRRVTSHSIHIKPTARGHYVEHFACAFNSAGVEAPWNLLISKLILHGDSPTFGILQAVLDIQIDKSLIVIVRGYGYKNPIALMSAIGVYSSIHVGLLLEEPLATNGFAIRRKFNQDPYFVEFSIHEQQGLCSRVGSRKNIHCFLWVSYEDTLNRTGFYCQAVPFEVAVCCAFYLSGLYQLEWHVEQERCFLAEFAHGALA